ncbi:MAG: hypothetical protein ACR2P0_11170 [Acidimicrobiales bacterium]
MPARLTGRTSSVAARVAVVGSVVAFSVAQAHIVGAQVTEGDVEIVNVRETDDRLGPLVFTLVGLGIVALVATALFFWFTRPGWARRELTEHG